MTTIFTLPVMGLPRFNPDSLEPKSDGQLKSNYVFGWISEWSHHLNPFFLHSIGYHTDPTSGIHIDVRCAVDNHRIQNRASRVVLGHDQEG